MAFDLFVKSFTYHIENLGRQLLEPSWTNFVYLLIGLSLFFWFLEIVIPWCKQQSRVRKDFWLDGFYMFFNLFIFPILGFAAMADLTGFFYKSVLGSAGITNTVILEVRSWPYLAQLLLLFLVRDFAQWNVHQLLHRVPWLWEFHKVHHSVEQMGFAAHLRYHWMENIVYRLFESLVLSLIGFGVRDFFIVYLFTLAVGHFNHSNIKIPLGPLRFIFNNPQMHIWHHAKHTGFPHGVNFGLTLSLWDYLFGTAYVPRDGRDEPLGFDGMEEHPTRLLPQLLHPLPALFSRNRAQDPPADPAGKT